VPFFVVATPLGNLEDISPRVAQTLKDADVVFAEDTRHSRKLLDHVGSRATCWALHDHNEDEQGNTVSGLVRDGKVIALISDAGTPCISDPGYRIVRRLREEGARVTAIPGPSAVVTFLSAAGLPTDQFLFVGFPPRRTLQRTEVLSHWIAGSATTVLYESPHRIQDVLDDVAAQAPDRLVCVARELTKMHEQWYWGTEAAVAAELRAQGPPRGEFVMGISGAPVVARPDEVLVEVDRLLGALAPTAARTKELAQAISGLTGASSSVVYERLLALRNKQGS